MIPEKLLIRNFLCYRDDLPALDFGGLHIACLSGENGSGKSALLDAITWALWGKARASSDDDLISLGEQEMEVEFQFLLGGTRYRVLRKRSKAKRGQTALELQVESQEGWRVLSGSTIRETQQAITHLLRMEYETFINSAFLVQGKADEFTRRPPAERKKVLAEILGLDMYEQLETRAKERARALHDRLQGLGALLGELESQAARREFFAGLVAHGEELVRGLNERVGNGDVVVRDMRAQIAELETRRATHAGLLARLEGLRRDQLEQSREAGELRQAIAAAEELLARREEILAGTAALAEARQALEAWDESRARWFELREQEKDRLYLLRQEETRLEHQRDVTAQEVARVDALLARRPVLEADLAQATARLGELDQLAAERDGVRAARETLEEQSRQLSALLLERQQFQSQVDLRRNSLVAAREEQQRRVADLERRLRDEPRWRQDLERLALRRADLDLNAARLAELRVQESASAERVGELRAMCKTIETQGRQVREKIEMLKAGEGHCPLCRSELGHDGIAHIEDSYQQERVQLLEEHRGAKREADALEAGMEDLRQTIAGLEQEQRQAAALAGQIAQLEARLAEAQELRRQLEEEQATLAQAAAALDSGNFAPEAQAELRRVEAALAELGLDQRSLERERGALDQQLRRLEAGLAERPSTEGRVLHLRSELQRVEGEVAGLAELTARLHQLEKVLADGAFASDTRASLAALRDQIAALGYTPEQHEQARAEVARLQPWVEEERRLAASLEGIERDRRSLAFVEEQIRRAAAEIVQLEAQAQELADQVRVLPDLNLRLARSEQALAELRDQLAAAQHDLGQNVGYLRQAEAAAAQISVRGAERRALLEEQELYEELARSFGKKGVQAMLIETAIPELEREANALLARMTDNQMHLAFETQRDTKKGDTVETLEIKIADLQGTRDYALYSGGEAFRVNFAIRIALSKLLARRAGASLQTLILDEGFGTQDGRGRERIVEAITSVQRDFARIFVITHIQELKDLFPTQIEIVKTPTGSQWSII